MIANHERFPLRKIGGRREEYYPTLWDAPARTLCVGGEATQGKRSGGASSPVHPSFYEERKETVEIRNYNITPQLPPNGLTVSELFCGGGLMAVGLKAAGYDIIFANDFDKRAAQAYAYNIGDHVVCGDITSAEIQAQIPDVDIIAGGPPCQDYSVAGSGAGEAGERGRLVWTYLDIIARKQPKAFVFENVKGLITKKHRPTFDALLARFDDIGYAVTWRLINAWDYGVAQKRERVFIVGIRKDLGFAFEFPEPTADEYRTQVLRDVIGDLPEPHGVELTPGALAYMERDPRHYQKHKPAVYDEVSPTLPANLYKGVPYGLFYPENHEGARPTQEFGQREKGVGRHPLSSLDDAAYTVVASTTGGKNAFYPDNHDRASLTDGAVAGAQRRQAQGSFHSALRTSEWEEPAYTITTQLAKDPTTYVPPTTHPRRFTVRECLRIQSVPDWYVLPDTISLSAQYRIVGNGVASRVAYRIGVALAEQLNVALAKQTQHERRAA